MGALTEPKLKGQDRWASVPKDACVMTARYRHIVRKGAVTSACCTTVMPAEGWDADTTKPPCPDCVRRYLTRTSTA